MTTMTVDTIMNTLRGNLKHPTRQNLMHTQEFIRWLDNPRWRNAWDRDEYYELVTTLVESKVIDVFYALDHIFVTLRTDDV